MKLTPRELDLVRLLQQAKTDKEMAAELGIAYATTRTLLRRAYTKLGVHSRAELVLAFKKRHPCPTCGGSGVGP